MEGGTIPQIAGGQIGGRSNEFSQTGCICPSTQRQTQAASALSADTVKMNDVRTMIINVDIR
jgi:hypothetical protein